VSSRKEIQNRFVAVCDVLGFKQMLADEPLEELAERCQRLINSSREVSAERQAYGILGKGGPLEWNGRSQVGHAVFSDSLVLWSGSINEHSLYSPVPPGLRPFERTESGDSLRSARLFFSPPIRNTRGFFQAVASLVGIGLLTNMPLRIGMSFGACIIKLQQQIFVGRPFADAYETEMRQDWIGGAVHPSCFRAPKFGMFCVMNSWWKEDKERFKYEFAYRYAIESVVPQKADVPGAHLELALNWPFFLPPRTGRRVERILMSGYDEFEDSAIVDKWIAALAFYRRIRRRGYVAGDV
jgi:hypothetical protein